MFITLTVLPTGSITHSILTEINSEKFLILAKLSQLEIYRSTNEGLNRLSVINLNGRIIGLSNIRKPVC